MWGIEILEAQKWWICLERYGEWKGEDIEWESWEAQRPYFEIWPLEQSFFFFFFPVAERWSKVKGPTRQIVTASLLLFSFLFWAFICVVVIWIAGFELYSWWFSFFPDSEGLFFRQSYHVVTYTWSFIPSYHLVLLRFCSTLWSINYSSKAKANKEIINESKIT